MAEESEESKDTTSENVASETTSESVTSETTSESVTSETTSESVTSETTSESTQSTQQERPKLPPVDFTSFISELATTAFAYMGGFQNPETKEVLVDLEMVQRMIDTLDLLKEKTKGNLTTPEDNFLDNTLYDLKMSYLRVANNPPPKPETTESEPQIPSEASKTDEG